MLTKRDYYQVLGVSRTADEAELKRAYRKIALDCHPDRNPGNKEAEERFKEASEAYEVLRDPDRRASYDRYGHEGLRQQGFEGFSRVEEVFGRFSDMFSDFFGDSFHLGRGGRPRGSDVKVDLELTFAEAVTGVSKELKIPRRVPCEACQGTGAEAGSAPVRCSTCGGRGQVLHSQGFFMIGTTCPTCRGEGVVVTRKCAECRGAGVRERVDPITVNVPAGVDDGRALRMAGKGEAVRGGQPGHLYLLIHVAEDPRFRREGADVLVEAPVSFPVAALGGKVTVPTLEEGCTATAEIEIEPGTQPGDVVVRKGQGITRLDAYGRGDFVIQFKLEVPTSLTDRQKELLSEFAAASGEEVAERRSIFGRKKKRQ